MATPGDSSSGSNITLVLGDISNMLGKVLERLDKTESKIESMEHNLKSQSSSSGMSSCEHRRKVPTVVRVSVQHSLLQNGLFHIVYVLCQCICAWVGEGAVCTCVRDMHIISNILFLNSYLYSFSAPNSFSLMSSLTGHTYFSRVSMCQQQN